jgi:tetratricopeptide (TPR) repeat protein
MKKIIFVIFIIIFGNQNTFSQSDKETALIKAKEAIKLMDEGKLDESIKLLEEAEKLDSEKFNYPYEKAYAYYLKQDYNKAIKISETVKKHKNVMPELFQLMGNSYDILEKPEKALEVYDEGLKKFPNAGMLYLEKGNVYWNKKNYEKALPFYEKGIEVNPMFPSNYFRAAKIYCNSSEEVWGMIYGEIFINLERNSDRTYEISKLLFDTYKREIKFKSETTTEVSFSKNTFINVNDLGNGKQFKLPFTMVYEPTLLLAVTGEKSIDLNSLNNIRQSFIKNLISFNHNKTNPNVLFDYQIKMSERGDFEAYNYWLLSNGDKENFDKWMEKNKEKWDKFVKWFTVNKIKIDDTNKFLRSEN